MQLTNIMKTRKQTLTSLLLIILLGLSIPYSLADSTKNILVFGDSLSAAYGIPIESGWVSLMQRKLTAEKFPYRIENTSVSGETTSGGKQRFALVSQRIRPSIVILELGANDGLRGLDLTQTQLNLANIIESAQSSGAEVLLLGVKIPPNYGPAYTKQFEAMYHELAKRYHVTLIPFFLDNVAGKPELTQADGLHPNQDAQSIIMQNVWEGLHPLLQKKKR